MTLLELLSLLRKHLKLVIALPVVLALACAVVCLFIPNTYTATTSMYVLSSSDSENSSQSSMYTDLTASQMIANDVASIAKFDRVAADVAQQLGMSSLDAYKVKVDNSSTTRIITLSVSGTNPTMAANVANTYVKQISDTASSVMAVKSVNVIDSAVAPSDPSGPNRPLYIAVAFLVGLFLAIAIVVIADTVNTRARTDEEVVELSKLPIVGHFPKVK